MKRIMKLLLAVIPTAILIMTTATMSFANTLPDTDPGWNVTYTSGGELKSNFTTGNIDQTIGSMQPGDEAHFSITVTNENSATTDWYMENAVVYSMEDRSKNSGTKGGAYTYKLSYTDASGNETVFFDSTNAGGDISSAAGSGLHEATNGQEGWFYLSEISSGAKGTINMIVALDGETQGNNYQDTLADLQLRFSVELADRSENTTKTVSTGTKTGDDTNLGLYVGLCAAAGLLMIVLACISAFLRRKERRAENEK